MMTPCTMIIDGTTLCVSTKTYRPGVGRGTGWTNYAGDERDLPSFDGEPKRIETYRELRNVMEQCTAWMSDGILDPGEIRIEFLKCA